MHLLVKLAEMYKARQIIYEITKFTTEKEELDKLRHVYKTMSNYIQYMRNQNEMEKRRGNRPKTSRRNET